MNLEALFPASGNNAIQSVAFSIEWANALTDDDLEKVRGLHDVWRSELPTASESQMVTFTVETRHGLAKPSTSQVVQGAQFLKENALHPSGFTRSLQVNRDNLIVTINDYDSWKSVFPAAFSWISAIVREVGDSRGFTILSLQYHDTFLWRDDPLRLDLREVFRAGSAYIPQRVLTSKSLWHVHQGYMEIRVDPVEHSVIDNVNVDLIDNGGQRTINAVTLHRTMLKSPIWRADELMEALDVFYSVMHEKNKGVFVSVFSEEVCRKVRITSGGS